MICRVPFRTRASSTAARREVPGEAPFSVSVRPPSPSKLHVPLGSRRSTIAGSSSVSDVISMSRPRLQSSGQRASEPSTRRARTIGGSPGLPATWRSSIVARGRGSSRTRTAPASTRLPRLVETRGRTSALTASATAGGLISITPTSSATATKASPATAATVRLSHRRGRRRPLCSLSNQASQTGGFAAGSNCGALDALQLLTGSDRRAPLGRLGRPVAAAARCRSASPCPTLRVV